MLKMSFITKSTMAATVLAVFLTVFSTTSVFAAPAAAQGTGNNNSSPLWTHQTHELRTDLAIYEKFKKDMKLLQNSSKPAELQQYLNEFAVALTRAEALIKSGHSSSNNVSINKTPGHELAAYLHLIRGIENKIGAL